MSASVLKAPAQVVYSSVSGDQVYSNEPSSIVIELEQLKNCKHNTNLQIDRSSGKYIQPRPLSVGLFHKTQFYWQTYFKDKV